MDGLLLNGQRFLVDVDCGIIRTSIIMIYTRCQVGNSIDPCVQ